MLQDLSDLANCLSLSRFDVRDLLLNVCNAPDNVSLHFAQQIQLNLL